MWATINTIEMAKLPDRVLNGRASSQPSLGSSLSLEADGWKNCIDRLLEVRLLEEDWDGQGSPAPIPELVDSAIILAVLLRQQHVKPPDHTIQTVQGGVNLHWEWPDRSMFEVEVIEPYLADVYLMLPDRPCEHWQMGEGVTA